MSSGRTTSCVSSDDASAERSYGDLWRFLSDGLVRRSVGPVAERGNVLKLRCAVGRSGSAPSISSGSVVHSPRVTACDGIAAGDAPVCLGRTMSLRSGTCVAGSVRSAIGERGMSAALTCRMSTVSILRSDGLGWLSAEDVPVVALGGEVGHEDVGVLVLGDWGALGRLALEAGERGGSGCGCGLGGHLEVHWRRPVARHGHGLALVRLKGSGGGWSRGAQ
ncbi:uncharacterized protein LOC62_03G003670 [Vanrija pseudolonga]|uniref:Uncharacterized protein n=1 Tax=Vanrija pseudolonga TaxID=143232 RepID=A0AAF1BQ11_9TREE|nr:hypothetical protein LOC62_03G003670 [Vanrija pseudolonga]